ncbi:DUF6344 domain-containing protein [Streptomyces sp. NPDC046909]|uniref:DUF6344 domain-containing protein n=1 Tax=Streptomyces sp. NPDC046909 TaxID=3155617 RepID=UPI0033C6DCC1
MAQNKVMKLWTAIVTALLALCTALGLVTTTAAAATAAPQTGTNGTTTRHSTAETTTAAPPLWSWSWTRSLPPTMKQRIRAEAHGKTPSCRHRPPADDESTDDTSCEDAGAVPDEPAAPLQR